MTAYTEKPYFLKDPSWYYFDEDEVKYKLTDKAPEEARKSYEEFYGQSDLEGEYFIDRESPTCFRHVDSPGQPWAFFCLNDYICRGDKWIQQS